MKVKNAGGSCLNVCCISPLDRRVSWFRMTNTSFKSPKGEKNSRISNSDQDWKTQIWKSKFKKWRGNERKQLIERITIRTWGTWPCKERKKKSKKVNSGKSEECKKARETDHKNFVSNICEENGDREQPKWKWKGNPNTHNEAVLPRPWASDSNAGRAPCSSCLFSIVLVLLTSTLLINRQSKFYEQLQSRLELSKVFAFISWSSQSQLQGQCLILNVCWAGFAGFIVLIVMCSLVVHGFRAVSRQFHDPALVFKRKVVWITGASSGLGEALAYQFARSGARLILSSRRCDELERVKSRCVSLMQNGSASDVMILPLDLSKVWRFRTSCECSSTSIWPDWCHDS